MSNLLKDGPTAIVEGIPANKRRELMKDGLLTGLRHRLAKFENQLLTPATAEAIKYQVLSFLKELEARGELPPPGLPRIVVLQKIDDPCFVLLADEADVEYLRHLTEGSFGRAAEYRRLT